MDQYTGELSEQDENSVDERGRAGKTSMERRRANGKTGMSDRGSDKGKTSHSIDLVYNLFLGT
jgi:hypothetical protein